MVNTKPILANTGMLTCGDLRDRNQCDKIELTGNKWKVRDIIPHFMYPRTSVFVAG